MSAALMAASVGVGLLAAALGAGLRFVADRAWGAPGVLAANTAASFLAGLAAAEAMSASPPQAWSPVVVLAAAMFVLALGTFSTVAVDAAEHALAGRILRSLGVWALHLTVGVLAAALGFALAGGLLL